MEYALQAGISQSFIDAEEDGQPVLRLSDEEHIACVCGLEVFIRQEARPVIAEEYTQLSGIVPVQGNGSIVVIPDGLPVPEYLEISLAHRIPEEVNQPAIRVFLGHNHLSTTEIYAKISQPELDKAIIEWNASFWSGMEENVSQSNNNSDKNTLRDDDIIPDFLR